MVSTIRSWIAICAVILLLAVIPAGEEKRCHGSDLEAIESFEVAPRKGSIVLPVTIGGERYNFILDTGSPVTIFDHQLRAKLGEPVGEVAVGDTLVAKEYKWPGARLGSMDFACETPIISLDLSDHRERTGQDFFGIIGSDWLSRRVFELDPDEGRIRFLRPISAPPPGTVALPIKEVEGMAYVQAEIAGLGKRDFLFDTGLVGSCMLLRGDVQRLAEAKRIQIHGVGQATSLGEKMKSSHGNLEWLEFGGARLDRPKFYEIEAGKPRLLGMEIWGRYITVFDLPNHVLYLRKSKSFGEPWVDDLSGLNLLRRGGETIVRKVAAHADQFAIRKGDVLLRLDGKPAEDFSLWEISRLFSREGSRVILTIRRNREEMNIAIVLSRVVSAGPGARAENHPRHASSETGVLDKVKSDQDGSIRSDPGDAWTHLNRAADLGSSGKHNEAIAQCDKAIAIDRRNAQAYEMRAHALARQGHFERALSDNDTAIGLEPLSARPLVRRSETWTAKGEMSKAIRDLDEALRLDPKSAEARGSRGCVWSLTAEHEKAIVDFDESIRLDPRQAHIYYSRGCSRFALNDLEKAIADYSEVIRLDPRHVEAYLARGL